MTGHDPAVLLNTPALEIAVKLFLRAVGSSQDTRDTKNIAPQRRMSLSA
jgi:hypothetical protein